MRIGVNLGDWMVGSDLDGLVGATQRLEERGFASASTPNVFGLDAINALSVVGRETERIELVTAVVPTYPRHPLALAQQALTAQVACGGRFVLGIGLSHQIVIEGMFGMSFERPARHMREYLQVLGPLLEGESVQHSGEVYRVAAGLRFKGTPRVSTLVAALGPAMLDVAGRLSDGTITWMTGLKTLETHIVPRIREAAKEAGRPDPRVVAGFPIAITNEPDKAREAAGKMFKMYGTLPSYRAMLDREGASSPGDVAIVGDAATVEAELRRLEAAGVTDFGASPFRVDEGAVERTLDFLATQTGESA
ncbi:MAG: TIGR03564 family F420-dependent LLM class oxidoreductase [Myxococcota bacterium]